MPYTILICLLTKWNTFSHFLFWIILIPDSLSPSPPWSHSLSPFYLIPILWFPHPRVHHSMFPLFHYLASVSLFPHFPSPIFRRRHSPFYMVQRFLHILELPVCSTSPLLHSTLLALPVYPTFCLRYSLFLTLPGSPNSLIPRLTVYPIP